MAEHIVEHVRLLEVVDLVGRADEIARDEAAMGEMIEERLVGDQPGHRDHLPAGELHQPFGQRVEARDAGPVHAQEIEAGEKGGRHAPRQQRCLPCKQPVP